MRQRIISLANLTSKSLTIYINRLPEYTTPTTTHLLYSLASRRATAIHNNPTHIIVLSRSIYPPLNRNPSP
ncbi:hypothetical protein, partial [Pseudomonas aeruginosa]|uniref:hypothetical protein n=1 Tax=Pseudomonas aeruginosa TaxID=287 RepID=UPI001C30F101